MSLTYCVWIDNAKNWKALSFYALIPLCICFTTHRLWLSNIYFLGLLYLSNSLILLIHCLILEEPLDEGERGEWQSWLKTQHSKAKIMESGPITLWQIEREKVEAETDFIFLNSRTTVDGDYSYKIKRHLLFERKTIRNLYAKSLQLYLTLCDPRDYSPLASYVHGILQERILQLVAMPSPGDLPDPATECTFLMFPALASGFFTTSTSRDVIRNKTAYEKAETSLCWQRSIYSKLFFFFYQ